MDPKTEARAYSSMTLGTSTPWICSSNVKATFPAPAQLRNTEWYEKWKEEWNGTTIEKQNTYSGMQKLTSAGVKNDAAVTGNCIILVK